MRLIDAVSLSDGIDLHRKSTDQACEMDRQWAVGYNAGLDRALYSIAYAKTIVPPPNEPLTLKELREMDGEPVWINDIMDGISIKEYWALLFSVEEDSICFSTKECGDDCRLFNLFGRTWRAYNRKPEDNV